jgi:phosphocarrier protein HPr
LTLYPFDLYSTRFKEGCPLGTRNPCENMDQEADSESQERMVEVINKMGIHARPAAMIVRIANKHDAEVYVERDGELVNGKSIMGLMMLAAGEGSKLKFIASGPGAKTVLDEMDELFKSKFNEG